MERVTGLGGVFVKCADAKRSEGVKIDLKREDHEYGRFAWIYDPEGQRG